MSNNNSVGSKILLGVFFASLFAFSGIASCGSKPSATNVISSPATVNGTLSAVSTSIPYNGSTTIDWSSTNSDPCTFSGDNTTNTKGSFNTGALTQTTSYTLTCGSKSQSIQSITIAVYSSALSSVITGFIDAGGGRVTVISVNALTPGDTII
jgi:hypothetical protein